jgi:CheY-like chemotaxis protein
MEAVGQLAAGVAHDFNNILAVILGNASLLLEGKSPDDKETKPLQSICAASDRASKLVRQLLTLSRKQLPELRLLNVRDALAAVSETLPQVLAPKIDVEIQTQSDVPEVRGDTGMLEILLMNLALNARDAMPDGGRLSISVDSVEISSETARANPEKRAGHFVRLTVSDTGSGIAPEILPRIFEPFFTTKPVGQGTGLGLSAVYGITRQHDGWVEVHSIVNEGTTFQVLIPAIPQIKPAQQSQTAKPGRPKRGGETILVVEDDPDLKDLVSQILETSGYKVLTAGSGAEALEVFATSKADIRLLLTDMMLPDGLNGRTIAERLMSQNPQLRVIFTSGYSAGMPGTELADVDARQFLAKPYRPSALLELVGKRLNEPLTEPTGATA